jgi:hypothetical protein
MHGAVGSLLPGNAAVNMHPEQWETVFSVGSMQMSYLKDKRCHEFRETRMEAGSNTSTVTLRVVEGDEIGSLKYETVKYGRKSQGTRT